MITLHSRTDQTITKGAKMEGKIHLVFESAPSTPILELALFSQYFLLLYRTLQYIDPENMEQIYKIKETQNGLLWHLSYPQLRSCHENIQHPNDPKITNISQQSPLCVTICGCITLLTFAAILSGGPQDIKLGPLEFHFQLKSLGESLLKIKTMLSRDKSYQPTYGFSGKRIKLNEVEYIELMKKVNSNGGFQLFQQELQRRINPTNRILSLSNADVGKILRYKNNPKKGGFQLRFDKIFGRHFK